MTIRRSGAILLTLLLTGCGFFGRTKNTFYSLEPIPPTAAAASFRGTPIGIDGIELPPGLDRREIVVRGNDQRLEVRGTQQWAAPLEDMVIHTLAFDLANRLPEGMVILPGEAKPSAMRSVYLVLEDLAAGQDRVFVLDARWKLTTPGQPELTRHERITVNLDSLDSAKIASAMSSALATLAERIVAAL
jgi:uncharacterized lipoprotein YmbA